MSALDQVPQRDQEWLQSATPDQISQARAAGELAELLGAPIPVRLLDNSAQLTAEDLDQLTPDQVTEACAAGRLTTLGYGARPASVQ